MAVLAVMGSGETAPSMVETHKRLFARAGPDALLVDTPYGFQENADELTARARHYFEHNVGHRVRALSLPRPADLSPARREQALIEVADADWLFAGPGSPSYLLRQWREVGMAEALAEALGRGAVLVFASAAACTLGRVAVPVYEIYKAGADPSWLEGLDLMRRAGLDAVVVPHFDNAEGGTHDTRYCYLGERRLALMEERLPAGTWVLGVDEHTAAILDLAADTLTVEGRGGVTVRSRGSTTVHPAGTRVPLGELAPEEVPDGGGAPADPGDEDRPAATHRFRGALAAGEVTTAVDAALELAATAEGRRTLARMITRLGRLAEAGLHDHRELVAPHVELLLELREAARSRGEYATADRIRDRLAEAGVEVRDTRDGPRWELDDPLA